MTNCLSCNDVLVPIDENNETNYQFDNALWVGFFGGYSMFVDGGDDSKKVISGSDHEAVICHDCAHKLCEMVPWINKLINPESSHAHLASYWEANPEHKGWDNPDPKSDERKSLDARLAKQRVANEEFMKKVRKNLLK